MVTYSGHSESRLLPWDIVGDWPHIFTENGAATGLRIAFDLATQRLAVKRRRTYGATLGRGRTRSPRAGEGF